MGYQDKNRPKSKKKLICDIQFDLTDLYHDVNLGSNKPKILAAIDFIRGTVKKLKKKKK